MNGANLQGFLFGNIDEKGNLEDDFFDEELRTVLNKGDVVSRLEASLDLEDLTAASTLAKPNNLQQVESTDDKVILQSMDIDGDVVKRLWLTRDRRILKFSSLFVASPAYTTGRYRLRKIRVKKSKLMNIQYLEDQTELFKKFSPNNNRLSKKPSFLKSLAALALAEKSTSKPRGKQTTDNIKDESTSITLPSDKKFHPVELMDWEDNIVFDAVKPNPSKTLTLYAGILPLSNSQSRPASRTGSSSSFGSRPTSPISGGQFSFRPSNLSSALASHRSNLSNATSRASTPILHQVAPRSIAGKIINEAIDTFKWEDEIIWDMPSNGKNVKVLLNMNDPNLIFEPIEPVSVEKPHQIKPDRVFLPPPPHHHPHKKPKKSERKGLVINRFDKMVNDRFNLSNDRFYEVLVTDTAQKGGGSNIRSASIAPRLAIQHSVPALKLSFPFFKTFCTKSDLRSWHRPKIALNVHKSITFDRCIKTKESLSSRKSMIINNTKNLSLRDRLTDNIVVMEYSEEFPLLMMNSGMGTFVYNFYRKTLGTNEPVDPPPKPFGINKTLESNEASPFWFFGDIRPGQSLSAIQNNLFRAPLFEHSSSGNDFLALRFNQKGLALSKWYLKELPTNILTVGQVFPTLEVFGPHSRRHNAFCRARVQAFAYRLFRKDSKTTKDSSENFLPRLKIARIMAAFPQYSEGSLRKWLKEYADSVRSGVDSGSWKMRRDAPILTEEDIRSLVTPEMCCQYEAMLAGQQRLGDSGYAAISEVDAFDDEEANAEAENSELRLAPWNLSANFISATTGRCTLELYGAGDPSGRGEAFSFAKVPQKAPAGTGSKSTNEVSKPPPGKAEQLLYKQEIVKIWDAQLRALSNPVPPEVDDSGDFGMFDEDNSHEALTREDDSASVISKSSQGRLAERKLMILRKVSDPGTGNVIEEVEEITDSRIISAYLNKRKSWQKKRRRREIAAAASAARTKKTRVEEAPRPQLKLSIPKKEISVKCGTCGQVGHMRTNRICPMYVENSSDTVDNTESGNLDQQQPSIPLKISIKAPILKGSTDAKEAKVSVSPPRLIIRKKKGFDVDKLDLEQRRAYNQLTGKFMEVLDHLHSSEGSWPFHKPVSKSEYPHYFKIVAKPLDFSTIKSRIKRNYYARGSSLLLDIQLIRDNCLLFNGADHPFSTTIQNLFEKARDLLGEKSILELEESIHGANGNDGKNEEQASASIDEDNDQLHVE